MAEAPTDPFSDQFPSTPQAFSFGGTALFGFLTGWGAQTPRRHVVHHFVKRRGARVEDMEQAPRTFSARLIFVGSTAAKDYAKFKAGVADNPRGQLVHPVVGKWQAFCQGPDESVDFARAINEIQVNCSWIEDELDAQTPRDVPDVATAAQDATSTQTAAQVGVANYLAATAKAQVFLGRTLAAIDQVQATIDQVEDPINTMGDAIKSLAGVPSALVSRIVDVQAKSEVAFQALANYVASATDLFNGGDQPAGQSDASATLLGVADSATQNLEASLAAASPSPAGAGESVGLAEEALSSCYLLAEALAAARPPTVLFVVPALTDVVSICVRLYGDKALGRVVDVLSLNRIPNPAAVPAGTVLRVPSR
jgi:hypothetical protein